MPPLSSILTGNHSSVNRPGITAYLLLNNFSASIHSSSSFCTALACQLPKTSYEPVLRLG